MSFTCIECCDTQTIDRAGAEITCPYCTAPALYHPSSVTVKPLGDRWCTWDTSWSAEGVWYGQSGTYAEASVYQRRRQGVIKAAISRRRNKETS